MPIGFGGWNLNRREKGKLSRELIERIQSLESLNGVARIREVHEGDDRLAILIPNIHGSPLGEDAPDIKEKLDAITGEWAVTFHALTQSGISKAVATESRPFSPKPVYTDKKYGREYGVEDTDNSAFGHILVGYRFFLPGYLQNADNRAQLEAAIKHGISAGDFLFERFVESPSYEQTFKNAPPEILSRKDARTADVKKEVADIGNQLFSSMDDVTPENASAYIQGLNHLFDTHVAIRRNEFIADNITRLFDVERRKPIIVKLGANHFSKGGGFSGIQLNTVQELLKEKGCSYVILSLDAVEKMQEERMKD